MKIILDFKNIERTSVFIANHNIVMLLYLNYCNF